jgi:hypothetical protein
MRQAERTQCRKDDTMTQKTGETALDGGHGFTWGDASLAATDIARQNVSRRDRSSPFDGTTRLLQLTKASRGTPQCSETWPVANDFRIRRLQSRR